MFGFIAEDFSLVDGLRETTEEKAGMEAVHIVIRCCDGHVVQEGRGHDVGDRTPARSLQRAA